MDLETVTEIGIEAETQTSINKKNDIVCKTRFQRIVIQMSSSFHSFAKESWRILLPGAHMSR